MLFWLVELVRWFSKLRSNPLLTELFLAAMEIQAIHKAAKRGDIKKLKEELAKGES